MARAALRSSSVGFCGAAVVLLWANAAPATPAPSLTATPHEVRRPLGKLVGLLRVWETDRWIVVRGVKGKAALTRIEYQAGFLDETHGGRRVVDRVEIEPADEDGFSGRIVITCAVRPDCERGFRVGLRLRDAGGGASEWVRVEFPPEPVEESTQTPPAAPDTGLVVQGGRRGEKVGVVQVNASAGTTMEEARAALERQARGLGGDVVIGLRVVASDAERVTFAADAVRYVEEPPATTASPTRAPEVRERPTHVLGEIFVGASRQ